MEFLEGKSLREFMRERGRLTVPVALHICTQIAGSLSEAHELGVIHRDLKPPNVMLVQRGDDSHFVKVVDFGLVKELEPKKGDEELTAENALIGSPRYMAPERFLYHSADSPSVDVYAIGIMLYEMLVGRPPFIRSPESTLQHIMMQHVQDEPPAMGKFAPDLQLPLGLEALIMRCLAKEPGERPTMAGLNRLLKSCAQGAVTIEDEVDSLPTIDDVRPVLPGETSGEFVTDDTGRGIRPQTEDATRPDVPSLSPAQAAVAPTGDTVVGTEKKAKSPVAVIVGVVLLLILGGVAGAIALFPGAEPTRLHITSEPPGAYVYMGPKQLGQTPFDIELDVQESTTLRFTREGHSDTKFVLNPGLGETFDVEVDLEPAAGSTTPTVAPAGNANTAANATAPTGSNTTDSTKTTDDAKADSKNGAEKANEAEKAREEAENAAREEKIKKDIRSIRKDRGKPNLDIKMDR